MNKTTKQTEALKLALEALKQIDEAMPFPVAKLAQKVIREALMSVPDGAESRSDEEQPAQPIRWDSAAVDMTGAMATLPKTGSESVVDYKFVDGTKVSETRATIEDGVVTSVTITNTAPPYINSTGADANIAGIPGTYYGIVPKGTGKITIREALAEKCVCGEPDTPGTHRTDGPCLAEQPAPAPPVREQQEPVAKDWSVFNTGAEVWSGLSLADAVAELTPERMERGWSAVCVINKANPPFYTSPPAGARTEDGCSAASKPWVGLTDDEKSDLWCESTGRDCVNEDTHVFADAIEAKLREKNA